MDTGRSFPRADPHLWALLACSNLIMVPQSKVSRYSTGGTSEKAALSFPHALECLQLPIKRVGNYVGGKPERASQIAINVTMSMTNEIDRSMGRSSATWRGLPGLTWAKRICSRSAPNPKKKTLQFSVVASASETDSPDTVGRGDGFEVFICLSLPNTQLPIPKVQRRRKDQGRRRGEKFSDVINPGSRWPLT